MAKRIKAIAFDFEGTIVGTPDEENPEIEIAHYMGFGVVAYVLDLDLPRDVNSTADMMAFEEAIPHSIGGGDGFNLTEMVKLAGRESEATLVEWLRRLKMLVYNDELDRLIAAGRVGWRPGAQQFFEFVEGLGLDTALGSLTPRKQAERLFEASGINNRFKAERIVLLEDVKNKKPAPDVYLETARRMDVSPSQQLVIGDSLNDVKAAVAAGSRVIAMPTVTTPAYTKDLMDNGAMAVFTSWGDQELYDLVAGLAS